MKEYENDPSLFFETYDVPEFKGSYQCVKDFFKRKHFSIRQAHTHRRGDLDPGEVVTYLDKIQKARVKYGDELLFNMDETSIYINNTPPNTIAPTGSEGVSITVNCNEKECFTAIGTCTKLRTYPLILLAKGKTIRCEEKFGRLDDTLVFHNEHGWTDESIMFKYLDWLHEQVGKDCALILDSFSAHKSDSVKNYAKALHIELIHVPRNGTGAYQPLDRAVFGAVKAKLAAVNYDLSDPTLRYKIVNKNLVQAWKSISKSCLHKAWCIPGSESESHANEEIKLDQ